MSLTRSPIGTPCTWEIGSAGQETDKWPARTISRPRMSTLNGRYVEIVDVIAERINLAGEKYTRQELVNTRFLFDRSEHIESLDGDQPGMLQDIRVLIADHAASVAAFRTTRNTQSNELSIEALEAMAN